MYRLIRSALALTILFTGFIVPFPAQAQDDKPTLYYLSVGTSLAAGIQADKKTGEPILTEDAYTDQIHQRIRGEIKNLEHEKQGCPTETSQSMIDGIGSLCYSEELSQLERAERFLSDNSGKIAFITIDIGANDLLPCLADLSDPGLNACVAGKLGALNANLNTILLRLRTAAPGVPIIAITYYNPYLAAWLQGPEGEAIAVASTNLVFMSNSVLGNIYLANGVPVADVAGAFATYDFTPKGNLPHNVKTVCQLTWNCEHDNIHPNDNGYKVIAKTVEQLMKSLGIL